MARLFLVVLAPESPLRDGAKTIVSPVIGCVVPSMTTEVPDSHTELMVAAGVVEMAVETAWAALIADGIVARRLPRPRLADAIRFTIGSAEDMQRVLKALAAVPGD